jgi:8-oxo-dGTP pyrophosphatase MutT (NUDIX family)
VFAPAPRHLREECVHQCRLARLSCAKVLLVDESNRVLLFSGIDRTRPEVPPWWFAVGGALEADESIVQGAIRETFEETGLRIGDPGPVVFTRSFGWDFEGVEYDQHEWFFLVRVESFTPQNTAWTATEAATIRGLRWWSVEELRSTAEEVFPEGLADRLEYLVGYDVATTGEPRSGS